MHFNNKTPFLWACDREWSIQFLKEIRNRENLTKKNENSLNFLPFLKAPILFCHIFLPQFKERFNCYNDFLGRRFPKFCLSYVVGLKQFLFCFSQECQQNYSSISGNWINNAEAIKPLFMRLNWQNEKSGISLYYTSKHNKSLFGGF